MEVIGKIIYSLPEVGGTSKAGNQWKKKEYVLETQETYPKKIHFDFFGDRVNLYPLQIGQIVRLHFEIESREYEGRWYTSIRGIKAEDPNANGVAFQQPAAGAYQQPAAGAYQQPAAQGYPQQAPYPGAPAYQQPAPSNIPAPPDIQAAPADDLPF